jgi:hypothetical protein
MALANTTLGAAKAASDTFLKVASATGFAPGSLVRIGDESYQVGKGYVAASLIVPVGLEKGGTVAKDHAVGAQVTVGTQLDWATQTAPQANSSFPIAGRARIITEYAADGAIALPPAGNDALAVIVGTAHTGMTLAAPTKDLNGCKLGILGLTGAAHVITLASGFGGGTLNTATFDTSGVCFFEVIAYNEQWYSQNYSGTLTSFDVALSHV